MSKKTASKLNPQDYKFLKKLLPLISTDVTRTEIKRAFALAPRELNRWLRQYRKEGPGFFYTNQAGVEIKSKGLVARVVRNIQARLNEAKKLLQSIGHFGLTLKK